MSPFISRTARRPPACGGRARLGLAFLLGVPAGAAVPGAAPPYRADRTDPKTIRIWGDPGLADLARIWEDGYRQNHPEIRFENRFISTAMAVPGIYLGIADLAFLGREPDVTDRDGFAHVRAYPPLRMEIATGSLSEPEKSSALVVFVHRDNPLSRLTLPQLAGAFGCETPRSGRRLRTWGDLGLSGKWAGRPINLYLFDIASGTGQCFLHAVLADSHKLAWERLREFSDRLRSDGTRETAGAQILAALRSDPGGLAVAGLAAADAAVKPLALATDAGGPFVPATSQTLIDRTYPLARLALALVNRAPGRPIDPKVAAFLRYLYSPEGEAGIRREGAFLPLNPEARRAQVRKLTLAF